VGIEGGVEEQNGDLAAFAWIVILSQDQIGKSRTGTFFLPPPVADLVRAGVELGEANDIVFHQANSKQANGAVGLLTGDVIDRQQLYEHAIVLALVTFKNPDLYTAEKKA
jgi:non-canonical (house-cleaning) NTP pyrophosphatase